jgi:hypothetical protein
VSRDEKFRLEQKFSGVLVGVLIFGLVWFLSKKVIKLNFFIKKQNRNRFKPTGFSSVWFFKAKTSSNRFGSVFSVLTRFFSGFFGSGLVFQVSGLKNQTGQFF